MLVEVEGTLNSRPLTYAYDEVGSEPLTPSHLLVGRRLKSMPDGVVGEESDEEYCSKRFRYLCRKKQHFWNRWRKEYLTDLREFHRGNQEDSKRVVKKGDVVVVFEDNVRRGNWKTAVVEELIVGRDEMIRGARVRLIRNGKEVILSRPVQKLYPIEVNHSQETEKQNKKDRLEKGNKANAESVRREGRPKRAAALDSEWRTRNMIN
ncbi:uncharacterized protein LOC114539721 [Dendronephthya gigantea]|uniref:uncharacterized protein LOC114539721 n=1 Tax=Dendronephthya gigantea TaxID=151771 RepID=UPI00106A24CD|nr:uncharacterized protein LOC114539721 [Dendronephthya gigantea]